MVYSNSRSRRAFLIGTGATLAASSMAGCISSIGEQGTDDSDASNNDDDSHEHTHNEIPDEAASEANVAMITDDSGHHFEPHLVWVETSGTVTWTNESGSHTATAYHPEYDKPLRIPEEAEPWDSGMYSEQGATFEHTFEVDGVYDYFCVPHEHRAMVGTVIVGDPDPHEQPGLGEPQDDLPDEAKELFEELNHQTNEALDHTH